MAKHKKSVPAAKADNTPEAEANTPEAEETSTAARDENGVTTPIDESAAVTEPETDADTTATTTDEPVDPSESDVDTGKDDSDTDQIENAVAPTLAEVLANDDLSMEEKIKWLAFESPTPIRMVAAKLYDYNATMKKGVADPGIGVKVSRQYDLLNTFRSVVGTEDYNEFKDKFDVVNIFVRYYAEEAFSSVNLCRFDYAWKWTQKELDTFLNLIEVITSLSVIETRAAKLKALNLEKAISVDTTMLSATAGTNLKRYYSK